MKILPYLLAGSALLVAGGAAAATPPEAGADTQAGAHAGHGQPAAQAPADSTAPPATAAPAPSADAPTSSANFTDVEVKNFAAAALKIQSLAGDEATKQQQMVAIVAEAGIDAKTFNAIGAAMQNDPALAKRVQVAAAELQKSAG
jgi:hypothetical protein